MKLAGWIASCIVVVVVGGIVGRTVGDGWAWTTLVALGFLALYRHVRLRAWLVVGCTLAGVGLALLFGGLGVPGALWFGLASGSIVIDVVDPGSSRRASQVGAVLGLVGLLVVTIDLGWWTDGRAPAAVALAILVAVVLHGPFGRATGTGR